MLKKAGIVTAGVTAGLLAISPLAFAGGSGWDQDEKHHGGKTVNADQINNIDRDRVSGDQTGLVNVGDVNALNNTNVLSCSFNSADVAASVLGILGGQATNGEDAPQDSNCVAGDSQTNIDD